MSTNPIEAAVSEYFEEARDFLTELGANPTVADIFQDVALYVESATGWTLHGPNFVKYLAEHHLGDIVELMAECVLWEENK